MKQMETTQKTIGGNKFYIRPFPAFTAANISGDLVKTLSPVIGAIASLGVAGSTPKEAYADIMNMDLEDLGPKFSSALSGLSGDSVERLMKKLLIDHRNVSVEGEVTGGETKLLDFDLSNEVFCADLQDMYLLCFEVVKVNFGGFFAKVAGQFGGLQGATQTKKPSESTETST